MTHTHRVRRMLVEFEQEDGKTYELEIKGIAPLDGKMVLTIIGHEPTELDLEDGKDTTLHPAHVILETRVIKHGKNDSTGELYTVREVRGTHGTE